jgi:hypothetical protein
VYQADHVRQESVSKGSLWRARRPDSVLEGAASAAAAFTRWIFAGA